jgi:GT2 family glycosyltransferase
MGDVAVIMLNWNGGDVAVESVGSMVHQTMVPSIWLTDNGSTDGSIETIAATYPQVHIIRNDRNRGYTRGVNQSLVAAGEPKYVVLANNDVILREPTSLARAVEYMDAHPDVNGVCGRYEYPSGEFQRFYNQLPTEFDLIVSWGAGRHLRPLLFGRRSRTYCLTDRDFDRPMTIEQPAFACVLMRGDACRRVGFLDEAFPIFFNDVDYCWRWREHGFTWHYLPDWHIVHVHGHSTRKLPKLTAELSGSAVRFARKYFPGASGWRIRTAITLEAAWQKYVHRAFPADIGAVWRGDLFHADTSGSAPVAVRGATK